MVDNLRSCIYHPIENPDCPIFRLDHILDSAEKNRTERDLILKAGGVIRVKLDWDCNLDRSIKLCRPQYSFARLDTPFHEEAFSPGFNFRFASHWKYGESYLRSLKKAYGLRLIISVSGKAGKFDFITLTLNTGSLVGIFGLATFFCDLVLLNLTKKASVYRDYVFQRVDKEVVRRNSVIPNTKRLSRPSGRIFENHNMNDRRTSQPFWTIENLERFSDLSSSPNQNRITPHVGSINTVV
jgi:P2X purinoceptor 1